MSNLLKKASIITTPTAYDDGRILSVKPNENIYGSEEIVNGDFATDSDWTVGSTWSISGGSANCDGGTSNLDQASIVTNTKYKVTITVSNITTGTLAVRLGGSNVDVLSLTKNGTYTGYGLSNGDVFRLRSQSGFDGSVDNVSVVEDLSGDFDFERGSAATRVNAQGLVENVQILSSELVQNGNFSEIGSEEVSNGDFSQEGSELVTNGDFSNGEADWFFSTECEVVNSQARIYSSDGGFQYIRQSGILDTVKQYKLEFDVISSNGADLVVVGASNVISTSVLGRKTVYFNPTSTYLQINRSSGVTDVVIDNVSVKEVGQGWTLVNGSISDKYNASMTAYQSGIKITPFIKTGNYKVVFDLVVTSGSCKFDAGNGEDEIYTTSGTKEIFITNPIKFEFNAFNLGWVGSLDNVSVKEVGQDWRRKDGEIVSVDSSGLVFDNSTGNASGGVFQNLGLSDTKKYRMTATMQLLTASSGGRFTVFSSSSNGASQSGIYSGSVLVAGGDAVTETFDFSPAAGDVSIQFTCDEANATYKVSNVSVVEVTDNTDLPRINYEGFSYQDIFGSELITNGDFAVDGSWVKGTGWTISGGSANGSSTTGDLYQENVVESGKKYKVTYTISNYVSGSVRVELSSNAYAGTERSANGTYTETILSGSTTVLFDARTSFTGSIDNVSVKEYLGQEVVPNSGCGSWLFEPQSTNLITYSEDFSQSFWNKQSNITPTYNTTEILSPDGTYNATKLIGNGNDGIYAQVNVSGVVSRSVYLRSVSDSAVVKLKDPVLTQTIKTITLNETWQRYDLSESNLHGSISGLWIDDIPSSGIYMWGAQLEQQSYATSYIPTNGASATRLQDIANNSGNSDLFNSTEGVLYAEISALGNPVSQETAISISQGQTGANRLLVRMKTNGAIGTVLRVANNTEASIDSNALDQLIAHKVAVKYKVNDIALWIDGIEIGTDNSANVFSANTLNEMSFNQGNNSNFFFGKNKALAVYKEALTDTELELLTAPAPEFPTFSLDFDTIAEQFTFTRGSEATFVNAQGLIESTASNDAPRIDYSTGAKAFLLEPQSTNLITYSEDFSQWTTVRSTATSGFNSPDGTLNAFKFTEDTDNNTHLFYNDGFTIADATEYTMSLFVKYNGRQWFRLYGQFGASNKNAYFDIQNGLLGFKDSGVTSKIKDYGNGWYRISQTVTSDGTFGRFRGYLAEADNDAFYQGDGTSGVYIWGGQYEQKSYPTSYIPTDGASATRNQETCVDATPTINSEEGVLYAEVSNVLSGYDNNIYLTDGTNNQRVGILFSNSSGALMFLIRVDGVYIASITISANQVNWEQTNKIAIKYKTNDMSFWLNGTKVATDTSGTMFSANTLTQLGFNSGSGGTFYGNTKGLQLFDKALSDYQLKQLTTI